MPTTPTPTPRTGPGAPPTALRWAVPAALLVLLATHALACSSGTRFGEWTPPVEATPEIRALEHELFERLNADRTSRGLPPLEYDERLADIARAHSADMRDARFFAHDSPHTGTLEDRMNRAGYLALEMRENLAVARNVQRAENNLLRSPGHERNIMSTSVTHLGIGIVEGSSRDPDLLTITQVFARPVELESPEAVAEGIITRIDQARGERDLPPLEPNPTLQEVAAEQLAALPDTMPNGSVAEVGDAVREALREQRGHGLGSIRIVSQLVFSSSEIDPPDSALTPSATHYGIATEPGQDERGRPRVKVLLLLGRRTR